MSSYRLSSFRPLVFDNGHSSEQSRRSTGKYRQNACMVQLLAAVHSYFPTETQDPMTNAITGFSSAGADFIPKSGKC